MENSSTPDSKYKQIWNKLSNSKLLIFIGGAVAYSLIDWVIPVVLSHEPKSEIIFSRIARDSIFKDSMFGEIPFKSFKFEISNIGDQQAEITNFRLTSFVDMDLGYDPNLVLIGSPSAEDLNIESSYFSRSKPLAPGGTTWMKLSMFKPAYDSLSNLYKINNPNSEVEYPSLYIEYTGGVAKELILKNSD